MSWMAVWMLVSGPPQDPRSAAAALELRYHVDLTLDRRGLPVRLETTLDLVPSTPGARTAHVALGVGWLDPTPTRALAPDTGTQHVATGLRLTF